MPSPKVGYIVQKVLHHQCAAIGFDTLWVELDAVQGPLRMFYCLHHGLIWT